MTINIILFNKCCILDDTHLYIYGVYDSDLHNIECRNSNNDNVDIQLVKSTRNLDICIVINKNTIIGDTLTFIINNDITMKDIILETPFEKQLPFLDINSSNIISTMCKDYNHRLDEWIQYNIKLGFDAIVIFDNSKNKHNSLNEKDGFIQDINYITDKYKENVLVIDCPYHAFKHHGWNMIQRITLSIAATAFKNKVRYISFIDADEFIYIPNTNNNIRDFLKNYDQTIRFGSKLLTNKNNNDIINNNILSLCRYIGPSKYTKLFLRTSHGCYYSGTNNILFLHSPHDIPRQLDLDTDTIIHYHCWVNNRCNYDTSFPIINDLYEFMQRT